MKLTRSLARPVIRTITPPASSRILLGSLALLLTVACALPRRPAAPAASPEAPPPAPPAEVEPVFYSLVVESRELGADVYLNDILVERVDPDDRATLSSGVNLWIVPGANRLELRSRKLHARAGAQHVVRVRISRRGAESPAEVVLTDVNLAVADPSADFAETRTFQAEPAPPAQLWLQARPLTLDEPTRTAGAALVRDLERAFHRRDLAAVEQLLEWKTVDTARAGFRAAGAARAAQRESLEGLFEDQGYVVDHFTPEALQFELRAGGRLLSIARPSGPVLQVRLSQGGRFRLPVLVANIGGTLRIVR